MVISDFSEVQAVAASSWFVYAATRHGLLIYDRVARHFRNPVTAIDGYPSPVVRRAIADPSANAVWLDLGPGLGYIRYDVDGRMWTPGALASNEANQTLTVEAALASAPRVDAMQAVILTDRRLRTHQFTAAAATPDRPEIFFGTSGLGLVRVDKQTGEWEVLTYGLLAPGVGAVAPAPGGVWAATSAATGRAQRRGLSWVASDVSMTHTIEGGRTALGFSFLYARHLLVAQAEVEPDRVRRRVGNCAPHPRRRIAVDRRHRNAEAACDTIVEQEAVRSSRIHEPRRRGDRLDFGEIGNHHAVVGTKDPGWLDAAGTRGR